MSDVGFVSAEGKKCLVLGVNGQDGSYLAQHLLSRNCSVIGVGRQANSRWIGKGDGFSYSPLDLGDVSKISSFLDDCKPDLIFHFAAVHGAAGFSYEEKWVDVHNVNTLTTHAVLEYLRRRMPQGALIFASSSKAFGSTLPPIISESSERKSTCIYSTTKNAATDLIHYYRTRHSIIGSVVWTFNHESARRPTSYFIPQIVHILARAILDRRFRTSIGTLRFWCDWGDAEEYMSIATDIGQRAAGGDFVLASGITRWAKDVVDQLFGKYGLRAEDHIEERLAPPGELPPMFTADVSHLRAVVGRLPRRTILDVCDGILKANHPEAYAIAGRN
jgi:GDPmannose 4,6-dehydratase